ncbi:MAG: response regulator transcription factor [Chloroflexi bacterium]|nr:response regulator transcription factor [Chloroflexota bacterium]
MNEIRVLVVDDHDLFRRGLMEVLEVEDDIQVIGEARNGQQAIDQAEKLSPDVVFMDLNMPEQNGIEATAYVRQMPGPTQPPAGDWSDANISWITNLVTPFHWGR